MQALPFIHIDGDIFNHLSPFSVVIIFYRKKRRAKIIVLSREGNNRFTCVTVQISLNFTYKPWNAVQNQIKFDKRLQSITLKKAGEK